LTCLKRWGKIDWALEDNSVYGIKLPLDILKALQRNCHKLRRLSLNLRRFPVQTKDAVDETWSLDLQIPFFDICSFRNLQTLEVLGIYGNLKVQARNLAVVLAENPGLTGLALSLQDSAIQQGYITDDLEDPQMEHNKFCWRMCSTFSNELKQGPLSLRRLHLGKPFEMTSTDLARLTNPALLEQVYQFVGDFEDFLSPYRKDPDFMVFSHENCPNLWEICAMELSDSFHSMLDSWPTIEVDGGHVSQWDRVQKANYFIYEIYRRKRLVLKDFDDRHVPGLGRLD
jgi:hypothetical protein